MRLFNSHGLMIWLGPELPLEPDHLHIYGRWEARVPEPGTRTGSGRPTGDAVAGDHAGVLAATVPLWSTGGRIVSSSRQPWLFASCCGSSVDRRFSFVPRLSQG